MRIEYIKFYIGDKQVNDEKDVFAKVFLYNLKVLYLLLHLHFECFWINVVCWALTEMPADMAAM